VDVRTNDGECISDSFHVLLQKLGAEIKKKFTPRLDCMIWKGKSKEQKIKNWAKFGGIWILNFAHTIKYLIVEGGGAY